MGSGDRRYMRFGTKDIIALTTIIAVFSALAVYDVVIAFIGIIPPAMSFVGGVGMGTRSGWVAGAVVGCVVVAVFMLAVVISLVPF